MSAIIQTQQPDRSTYIGGSFATISRTISKWLDGKNEKEVAA